VVHCRTVLVAFLRKQGKCPSADQRVEIAQRRAAIQSQIDTFHELAENLFPALDVYDIDFKEIPFGDDIISDAEDDDPSTVPTIHRGDVEKMDLLLPSAWPQGLPAILSGAREKEIQLRIAQADESLEAIRREICHKSYIYRTDVRLATNKKAKLRGYSAANAADRALKHQVRIYKQARWALGQLHAPATAMARYKPLLDSDLKALKSIYSPNEPGQSTATIPWIWKVNRPEGLDSAYIVERKLSQCLPRLLLMLLLVYRINWLRARSKRNRWHEESILVPMEMQWTVQFFFTKAKEWDTLASINPRIGPKSYAFRQSAMWTQLADRASKIFNDCRIKYSIK
jgi:hypothetical protein